MYPPACQLKGLLAVKGKTAPKGKSSMKGQTKGQVKGLMTQSQENAHMSLSDISVPTSTSAACGGVTTSWDLHDDEACWLPTVSTC